MRQIVIKEVGKFRDCGDIWRGYRLFNCEDCHSVKLFPLKCKGKFYLTCETGENQC
ncbi:MAG: transposase zinc-binding domain-containing protein [Enterococcus sp.]|nr:transposase zinc-binding domain-containing protein [Enterococcus sp.]